MYRALIVGATGAVGGALLRELLAAHECARVVALTRRPVDVRASPRFSQHVIDFDQLEREASHRGSGCDVAFCTVGIGQPRKVPAHEFRRVDVEYAGAFARGAAAAGARYIALLSSVGADATSGNRYLRVKGDAERAVTDAGIRRTSIFRPSLLVTDEIRYGLQDTVTQAVFPFIAQLLPARFHQIHVAQLARAMRLDAERGAPDGTAILQYPEIAALLGGPA